MKKWFSVMLGFMLILLCVYAAQADEPEHAPESVSPGFSVGPILIAGNYSRDYFIDAHFYQVDLESGSISSLVSINVNMGYTLSASLDANHIPCYFPKLLFSSDVSKLAVNWYDSSDGSHHVGWLDMAGNFTDVTNMIHPTGSGFSAVTPEDYTALFTPDGYFFFCDDNNKTCNYVDINTFNVVKSIEYPEIKNAYFTYTTKELTILPNNKLMKADYGRGADIYRSITMHSGREILLSCELTVNGAREYDLIEDYGAIGVYYDDNYDRYLIKYGEGITEKNSWGYYSDYNAVRFTPKTAYTLQKCSYKDGCVVFEAYRGNDRALFLTDLDGNSEPRKVTDLPTDLHLLCWR